MSEADRLQHFPISYFAIVMGLSGLTIAWEKAHDVLQMPGIIGVGLLAATVIVFGAILFFYGYKVFHFRPMVFKELHHPVKLNFFPTVSISMILLSICTLYLSAPVSFALWFTGSAIHLLFTLYVMQVWIHHEHFEIHHMNPAWFIPVVGNILVPVAGVAHGYIEISWFFFSIGLLFWLVLLSIVFNRVIFHQPIPAKLLPTLFILIAPPAVGFIAYVKLSGSVDIFARLLYYSALFLTLLLLTQTPRFVKLRFFLSWWAYSFPMAAITIATMLMYQQTGQAMFRLLAYILLAIITVLIGYLAIKTITAIQRRQICVEDG